MLRGRGGTVDATDLKSVGRKPVRVRLPPSAPSFHKAFNHIPQNVHLNDFAVANCVCNFCVIQSAFTSGHVAKLFDRSTLAIAAFKNCILVMVSNLLAQSKLPLPATISV
jgi:hypothetical protein